MKKAVFAFFFLIAIAVLAQIGPVPGGGGGSGTVTSIATTAPITGGTITTTGTVACATCATTTNGGALSGTSPIAVSAAGAIACATCTTAASAYTSSNFVQAAGNDRTTSDSGKAVPSGAVVGTTDTQSLTNKTLNGASNGNSVNLLNFQTSATCGATCTGTSSAFTVYTFTVPANTIGVGKGIQAQAWFHCSTCTTAVKVYSWSFGATAINYANQAAATAAPGTAKVTVFNTSDTSHQIMIEETMFPSSITPGATANPGETTTAGVIIKFTFNAPNTETITPDAFMVTLIQ